MVVKTALALGVVALATGLGLVAFTQLGKKTTPPSGPFASAVITVTNVQRLNFQHTRYTIGIASALDNANNAFSGVVNIYADSQVVGTVRITSGSGSFTIDELSTTLNVTVKVGLNNMFSNTVLV